jgi:hypothetical protein
VQGLYALQGTYLGENGKKYESGRITQSWASGEKYCGLDGVFGDYCMPTKWDWQRLPGGCEDLSIYDHDNTKEPMLHIQRMCKIPGIFFPVPNTTWYIPRKSALRLFMMDIITSIVDGFESDGKPKVTNHVLYDFDMQAVGTLATYEKMEGPTVANFSQYLFPLGFGVLPGTIRTGVFEISPDQQSF